MFDLSVGDQVRVCWQGADNKTLSQECTIAEADEKTLTVRVLTDTRRLILFDRTTGQQIHGEGGEYWLEMPF